MVLSSYLNTATSFFYLLFIFSQIASQINECTKKFNAILRAELKENTKLQENKTENQCYSASKKYI